MSEVVDITASDACDWPITNCYTDAWMLILAHWGLDPIAGLGITVAQDYEGDQFTFFKYQHHDLELLYGVVVGELSIYGQLEEQIETQLGIGRLVIIEADGFYLPDTRATAYRTQHTKTTIGVDWIDRCNGMLGYFHNLGHYRLMGEDYASLFCEVGDVLPPYVEFVKQRWAPLNGAALTDAVERLFRRHLHRRPDDNPILRYRSDFPHQMSRLLERPGSFHDYAFGIFRQLGANYQLLTRHIEWLEAHGLGNLADARDAARTISSTTKALQFKVARIASRRRFDACTPIFDTLERNYDTVVGCLERVFA